MFQVSLCKKLFSQFYHIRKFSKIASFKNYRRKLLFVTSFIGLSSIFPFSNIKNYMNNTSENNLNFIVDVCKKCIPSVVAVEIKSLETFLQDNGESATLSTGSGFVVNKNGWIITNAHVVMNKPNSYVVILTSTGEKHIASIEDIDLKLDLALLKISYTNLPPLKLGNSTNIVPGQWAVAFGCPLSLIHTVTAGIISSVNRDAHELGIKNHSAKYLQTDAAITFGHSGGPLVNLNGEVIGVNNLRITAGIAFAIPIDYVKEFLQRSSLQVSKIEQKDLPIESPYFGITTLGVIDDTIKNLLQEQNIVIPKNLNGILIWKVVNDSEAYKAGFLVGDIITHINNVQISEVEYFYQILSKCTMKQIHFTIYRPNTNSTLNLVLNK